MSQITPGPTTPSEQEPLDQSLTDGRSTRWADHREARRAELVRVARRIVHRDGPDVSMDAIAAAAGTSKSVVYRYFTDKTGLQIALADVVLLQMQGALEGAMRAADTPRDGLRSMVAVYLEMVESSPNVYSFVTRQPESGAPMVHFLDAVTAMVAAPFARSLTEDPSTAADAGPAIALAHSWAAGAVGFVRGTGEWWMSQHGLPDTPTRDELTRQVAAWLWAGPVGFFTRDRNLADRRTATEPSSPTSTATTSTATTSSRTVSPRNDAQESR